MRMSTRGRYALRAMLELAMCVDKEPLSLNHLSKVQDISIRYLEQLFIKLRQGGLITSVRGVNGGYVLSKDPKKITIGDIIRIVEDTVAPAPCVDERNDGDYNRKENCICHLYWKRLEEQIANFLDSSTLFDLCKEAKSKGLVY